MTVKEDAYEILARKLDFPGSARLRAILEELMTPQQAKIAVELPGSPEEVAQKLGLPVKKVKDELESLFMKGVVVPRDPKKRDYFSFHRSTLDLREWTEIGTAYMSAKNPRYYGLWVDFVRNEQNPWYAKMRRAAAKPYSRVIPAYKAIEGLPGIMPQEDVRELLKAQEPIVAVACPCRLERLMLGTPCERTKEEETWKCLIYGHRARCYIERGVGRRLSLEEAVKLADKIEEDGLIHRWFDNRGDIVGVEVSCNCCPDCCVGQAFIHQAGLSYQEVWEKSRYVAYTDEEKCKGCRKCVERCQLKAIEMRQVGDKKYKAVVDAEKCFGCGVCVLTCKTGARKLKAVRPPEHLPKAIVGSK